MGDLSFVAQLGLNALTAGIGSLLELPFASFNDRRQRRQMRYQADLQRQMFDYQAAYNSPAQQVQRLLAAGLNPNLVYGNGATATSSMPGVGSPSIAPASPSMLENFSDLYERTKLGNSQITYRDTQSGLTYQKTLTEQYNTAIAEMKKSKDAASRQYWQEEARYARDQMRLNNDLISANIYLANTRQRMTEKQINVMTQLMELRDEELKQLKFKVSLQPMEKVKLFTEIRQLWMAGSEAESRIAVNNIDKLLKQKGYDIWQTTGLNPNASNVGTMLLGFLANWTGEAIKAYQPEITSFLDRYLGRNKDSNSGYEPTFNPRTSFGIPSVIGLPPIE